jgi:hypothetical protein
MYFGDISNITGRAGVGEAQKNDTVYFSIIINFT